MHFRQDDYGERNFDDCGRSQTIHLPLAWWKAEQFIELSKDKTRLIINKN
jgi:hypothetical protein